MKLEESVVEAEVGETIKAVVVDGEEAEGADFKEAEAVEVDVAEVKDISAQGLWDSGGSKLFTGML